MASSYKRHILVQKWKGFVTLQTKQDCCSVPPVPPPKGISSRAMTFPGMPGCRCCRDIPWQIRDADRAAYMPQKPTETGRKPSRTLLVAPTPRKPRKPRRELPRTHCIQATAHPKARLGEGGGCTPWEVLYIWGDGFLPAGPSSHPPRSAIARRPPPGPRPPRAALPRRACASPAGLRPGRGRPGETSCRPRAPRAGAPRVNKLRRATGARRRAGDRRAWRTRRRRAAAAWRKPRARPARTRRGPGPRWGVVFFCPPSGSTWWQALPGWDAL